MIIEEVNRGNFRGALVNMKYMKLHFAFLFLHLREECAVPLGGIPHGYKLDLSCEFFAGFFVLFGKNDPPEAHLDALVDALIGISHAAHLAR